MPTKLKINKDFTEGYYKGRADMKKEIEEHSVFYSNRPIEDIVFEARADAIDECIKFIKNSIPTEEAFTKCLLVKGLEQLKEQ